jgi:hypothetical protein
MKRTATNQKNHNYNESISMLIQGQKEHKSLECLQAIMRYRGRKCGQAQTMRGPILGISIIFKT